MRLAGSRSVAVSTPGAGGASVADAVAQASVAPPPSASDASLHQTPTGGGHANAIMTRSRTRAAGAPGGGSAADSETFSLSASILTPPPLPPSPPSSASPTPTPSSTNSTPSLTSSAANSSSGSSSSTGSTPAAGGSGQAGGLPVPVSNAGGSMQAAQMQLHHSTRRRVLLSGLADRTAVGTSPRWHVVDNATDTRSDSDAIERFLLAQNPQATGGARRLGLVSTSSNASLTSAGAARTRERPRGPSGRMNPVPWNDEFNVQSLLASAGGPGAAGAGGGLSAMVTGPAGAGGGSSMPMSIGGHRVPWNMRAGWEELMLGAEASERQSEDVEQSEINAATAHLAKPKSTKAARASAKDKDKDKEKEKDGTAGADAKEQPQQQQRPVAMDTDSPASSRRASRGGGGGADDEDEDADAEAEAEEALAAFRRHGRSLLGADSDTDGDGDVDEEDQDEVLELAELGMQPNFANDMRAIGLSLLDFISRLMAYDPNASKYYAQVEEYLRERAEAAVAVDRGKAKQLVEMGFPEARARASLAANNGSFQRAVDWLLEHSADDDCECDCESGSPPAAVVSAGLSGSGSASSTTRERHPSVGYPFNLVRLFHKYHPPTSSPEHKTSEEILSRLIAMGFQEADVRAALEATDNNPTSALEWLLDESKRAAANARGRGAAGTSSIRPTSSDPSGGLSPSCSLHHAIFSNANIVLGLCNPRALSTVLQMLEQPESQVPWLLNDGGDLHSWVHTLSQVYHAERHAVPLSERRIPVDHRGRPLRTVRH